jgi:hypothetical protein
MHIPGLDKHLENHRIAKGRAASLVDKGRTIEDVKNDVIRGAKALGEEFDHNDLERAELVGQESNYHRYAERGAEVMQGNHTLPLPGLEGVDFKLTETGEQRKKAAEKDAATYGVHPESQASIAIDSDALPKVLKKGKFTNAFEVGGGIGGQVPAEEQVNQLGGVDDYYSHNRRKAEESLFGVPFHENDPNARPVYGVVRPTDVPVFKYHHKLDHYGDSMVDLINPGKSGKNTTITRGDSLDDYKNYNENSETPTHESTSPDSIRGNSGYTEMQWHDHPGVGDIANVHLQGKPQGKNYIIGQQFAHLGIPVTNHWTHTETQPSLFADIPSEELPKLKPNVYGQTSAGYHLPERFKQDIARPVRRGEPEYKD